MGKKIGFNWSSKNFKSGDYSNSIEFSVLSVSDNKRIIFNREDKYPFGGYQMDHTETKEYKFCWENLKNEKKIIFMNILLTNFEAAATEDDNMHIIANVKNLYQSLTDYYFYSKEFYETFRSHLQISNNSQKKFITYSILKIVIIIIMSFIQYKFLKSIFKKNNKYSNII